MMANGPLPDFDEERPDEQLQAYIARFWTVAELGDDLVIRITFRPERNELYSIRSEREPYDCDILDLVMTCMDEEVSEVLSEVERKFYQRMNDLLFHLEACIENNTVPVGKTVLWSEITNDQGE